MNLDDWRLVFISACLVLVLLICTPFVIETLKVRQEQCFMLAILGEEGKAEQYYPSDDPEISMGETVHWTMYLHNQMGEVQYVAVKVKLLNSTMKNPDYTSYNPSPEPAVYEIRHVLMNNETWLYPLNWNLINAELNFVKTSIKSMMINEDPLQINVESINGYNFRIVLELWVYDETSNQFNYGWIEQQGLQTAWNQIWFNVTRPG